MSDIIKKKCTGCSVIDGDIVPIGGIIYETENFILIQDAEICLKGFLIIQAKKHFSKLLDFDKKVSLELMNLIYEARKALKDLNICDEVTFVQEERSEHFHIWIHPYYEWMKEKFGKGIQHLRDINDYVMENNSENDKQEVLKTCEQLKNILTHKIIK